MSKPFVYTGQPTTYEEWRARNQPMKPRRYYVHNTATGETTRDRSKERTPRCGDCGEDGVETGHMECENPQGYDEGGSYYGDLPGLEPC